jgi:putative peptidoglycan lipid II flippase
VCGAVLAAALWFAARFATVHVAQWSALRDEATLAFLVAVGAIVYSGSILLLFGRRWISALVR